MKLILRIVILATFTLAASNNSFALSLKDVSGTFTVEGINPTNDQAYDGKVGVIDSENAASVRWQLPNNLNYEGVGFITGDIFSVAYGTPGKYGLVVYKLDGKGKLVGEWNAANKPNERGKETLEGSKDLTGTYKITDSFSSYNKNPYNGVVTITKTGVTYLFNWTLGTESYSGIGVLDGDIMSVAWGTGATYGVAAYKSKKDKLDGQWAMPTWQTVGTEVWIR